MRGMTKPQTYRVSDEIDGEIRRLAKVHGGVDRALRVLLAKPLSKAAKVAEGLAVSDLTAQVVEREDIEYGHHETLPRGEHVASRGFRGPILKPSEKGKK